MLKTYEEFINLLRRHIKNDDNFIYDLLITVVKNPNRYIGIFRLSNAKTKLIQNVTQSREIKFGDFMENIVTEYIGLMGYKNLNKNIGQDEDGNELSADQVFEKDGVIYLIEQKVRDDHDSTKKRGQYANFKKKYTLLKNKYPYNKVNASMWFIDKSLVKNKKYYNDEASKEQLSGIDINIYYGEKLFSKLFDRTDVWDEICQYLTLNKQERSNEILYIPDFDKSIEVKEAIKRMKKNEPKLYKKLISDKDEYSQLRKELFPSWNISDFQLL